MLSRTLLVSLALCAACTPADPLSEDPHAVAQELGAKPWGPQDSPNLLTSSMEYRLAQLPSSGQVDPSPWAGNYWPTYQDNINFPWAGTGSKPPSTKYAQAFGRTGLEDRVSREFGIDSRYGAKTCTQTSECDSSKGEACAKRTGRTSGRCVPTWFGICHAWAPAAVMEPEPEHAVTYNGVEFKVNDIKALVSLHYDEGLEVNFMSLRCNENFADEGEVVDGNPVDPQCQDTNAGSFHLAVANLVGLQGKSLIEDRTIDYEVWNQPIRKYTVTRNRSVSAAEAQALVGGAGSSYTPNPAAVSFREINLRLYYIAESAASTDGNLAAHIDTYTHSDFYKYVLELDGSGRIIGGEWIGSSRTAHPDFLWLPLKKNGTELARDAYKSGTGIKWSDVNMLLELSLQDDTGTGGGDGDTGGFDFGAACESGTGAFQQPIPHQAVAAVGTIPAGKEKVRIDLRSDKDVDVQLIDEQTGHQIIAWPDGDLNGASQACATYQGVQYCYSGYDGDQTAQGKGNEWIEIKGSTNRPVVMKAFGYEAGDASVDYSWESWCDFVQQIAHQDVVEVGTLPVGVENVSIQLTSPVDVDIQLFAGSTKIVQWPDGIMSGAGAQSTTYQGMTIRWSGYNGTGGQKGNEYITVQGKITTPLTMKAYGYEAGHADVDYTFGLDSSQL